MSGSCSRRRGTFCWGSWRRRHESPPTFTPSWRGAANTHFKIFPFRDWPILFPQGWYKYKLLVIKETDSHLREKNTLWCQNVAVLKHLTSVFTCLPLYTSTPLHLVSDYAVLLNLAPMIVQAGNGSNPVAVVPQFLLSLISVFCLQPVGQFSDSVVQQQPWLSRL